MAMSRPHPHRPRPRWRGSLVALALVLAAGLPAQAIGDDQPNAEAAAGNGGGADDPCDDRVFAAFEAVAKTRAQEELMAQEAVSTPPESVFELSCFEDIWNQINQGFSFNILFDSGSIVDGMLNQARERICGAAEGAWNEAVGRVLDVNSVFEPLQEIAGLNIGIRQGGGNQVNTDLTLPQLPTLGSINDSLPPPVQLPDAVVEGVDRSVSDILEDLFR